MTGSDQLVVASRHHGLAGLGDDLGGDQRDDLVVLGDQSSTPAGGDAAVKLLALRAFGKMLTGCHRVARCGDKIRRGAVGDADEILEIRIYCGHVWLCPTCAIQHARQKCALLEQLLKSWTATGGTVAMLTLTQAHSLDDKLADLWRCLDAGWSALQRGSGWRADRQRFGIEHYVRITEVIHCADAGWHPHFHTLILLNPAAHGRDWGELKDRLSTRFGRGVSASGGVARLAGQDLQLVDPGAEHRIAAYCTKGAYPGRPGRTRTPMTILADLMQTGEGIDLVKEFDTAVTVGKHRWFSPSRGISGLLSAGEIR